MQDDITPYSESNPITALLRLEPSMRLPIHASQYRAAEILACLQTLDDALREFEGRSSRRAAAAETWRELASDIVHALPLSKVQTILNLEGLDPFLAAKRHYTPSGNPPELRKNLMRVLDLMLAAAEVAIGQGKRYVGNYHGIICFQLKQLNLISRPDCALFHREFIGNSEPSFCETTGLVQHRRYHVDAEKCADDNKVDLSNYHPYIA